MLKLNESLIKLDFMFIYEHKVRELENLCLIKYELDRRGYTTRIVYIEDPDVCKAIKPIYYSKVVVMMACYQNASIEWHTKNFVKFDKLIDLQWENIVYPKDEKDKNAFKNYSGVAKEVVRVSWGNMNRKRMLEVAKMNPEKVKLIGHIGMDFLREEFKKYYNTKEEILKEYAIDNNKKILLFISPYFSDNHSEEYLDKMCGWFGEGWRDYYLNCMLPSKEVILNWMEKLCEDQKDIIFIYRPHPGEISESAQKLAEKYINFKVIGSKSVKQWIVISDKIYTGNSSTFVEAFFAKKMCYFLFPYPVPEDYELEIIKDADKIKDFESFKQSITEDNGIFPVNEESINEIYSIDWDVPSYVKFADMAEEVFKNDYYLLTKEQLREYRHKENLLEKIQKKLAYISPLYNLYLKLIKNERIHWAWIEKRRDAFRKIDENAMKNNFEQTSEQEIKQIITKIADVLT